MELLIVTAQSIAIYAFVVLALRWLGWSLRTELTPIGYLVIALIGSAVETGLYHGSDSLAAGLCSAATLLLTDYLTTRVMNRWPRLRRWLAGGPVVLVHDGHIISAHLWRVRLSRDDVRAALRKRGYDSLENVRLAVLESNGAIGVIPKEREEHR